MRGRTFKATAAPGAGERVAFPKLFAQLGLSPPDTAFTRRAVVYAREAAKQFNHHKQDARKRAAKKGVPCL